MASDAENVSIWWCHHEYAISQLDLQRHQPTQKVVMMPTLLWLVTQRKLSHHDANFIITDSTRGRHDDNIQHRQRQIQQLKHLRSENTPAAPWLPILVIHNRNQVKTRRQNYKLKKFATNSNFGILYIAWHATHLKLLDKMCKYEMDLASIVEDTDRTRFCPHTDGRTTWNQHTPFQLRWSGGYNKVGIITIFSSLTTIGFQWLLL